MNRAKIEDVLLAIGVPAGILGFNYIADAVECIDEHGNEISITKHLYPTIAKKNNTAPSKVERAIRHAFEVARSRKGNYEVVEKYIGFVNCKNSSSLAMLHKRIKNECEPEELIAKENAITEQKIREIVRQELRMFLDESKEVKV